MNLRRGIIAGLAWAIIGAVATGIGVAVLTFDRELLLADNLSWWRSHLYPGIVFIPMLLFFTGLVTYTPQRDVSFAKNLLLLIVLMIPLAVVLRILFQLFGFMPVRRLKGDDPPYLAQILVFLLPLIAVSTVLLYHRLGSEKFLRTDG